MSVLTIAETTIQNCRLKGSTATVRVNYARTFFDSDGVEVPGGTQNFYTSVACTINPSTHVLTIPAFSLITTTDSSDVTNTINARLYDARNTPRDWLAMQWAVPASLTPSTTWTSLDAHNASNALLNPPDLYPTVVDVERLISNAVSGSGAPKMNTVINGIATLYEAALSVTAPIVVGLNSLFIGSQRVMTAAAAASASLVQGTIGKLSNSFRGMVYAGLVLKSRFNLGVYSSTDFGAVDDGATDCTATIQAALDAAAADGGGVVRLVKSANGTGTFCIATELIVPQKVLFEGELAAVGPAVVLKMTGTNKSALEIRGDLTDVHVRNLSIFATSAANNTGIKFTGDAADPTQIGTLSNITMNGCDIGISVLATDVGKAWQCSYQKWDRITVHNCVTGILFDAINCDVNLTNYLVYGIKDSVGIQINNCGTLNIDHPNFIGPSAGAVCTVGTPNPSFSDTAIVIAAASTRGNITVKGGQAENFRKTLTQDSPDSLHTITLEGCSMGAPIELNDDTIFNSFGNSYFSNTVTATGDTDILSLNDTIDSRDTCLDPGTGLMGFVLSGNATISQFDKYGFKITARMFVGTNSNADDPSVAATPTVLLGSSIAQKILAYIGRTTSGAMAEGYKVKLDANDILRVDGTRAAPNNGVATTGFLECAGGVGVTTGAAGTVRSFFNGSFWQVFINGGVAKNPQISSVAYTAGAIPKQTSNSEQAASVLREDAGSIKQSSGNFVIESATGQFISNATTGTAPITVASTTKVANLNADKLDGQDFPDPGAIGGTTPAAITGTAITGNTSVTSPIVDASTRVKVANTGKLSVAPKTNDTYGAAMTIDVTISNHVIAASNTTAAAVTMTPSAAGTAGDLLYITTETDGTGTVTATFAATFHSSGTQATTASRFSTIVFQSDGTRWLELHRTTDLA